AEEGPAMTPPAAGEELLVLLDDIVGLVREELGIHAEHLGDQGLDLRRRVIAPAQDAGRSGDQAIQPSDFVEARDPQAAHHAPRGAEPLRTIPAMGVATNGMCPNHWI